MHILTYALPLKGLHCAFKAPAPTPTRLRVALREEACEEHKISNLGVGDQKPCLHRVWYNALGADKI